MLIRSVHRLGYDDDEVLSTLPGALHADLALCLASDTISKVHTHCLSIVVALALPNRLCACTGRAVQGAESAVHQRPGAAAHATDVGRASARSRQRG